MSLETEQTGAVPFSFVRENRAWLLLSVNRITVTQYLTQYLLTFLFVCFEVDSILVQ